jgi:hypothetical protein
MASKTKDKPRTTPVWSAAAAERSWERTPIWDAEFAARWDEIHNEPDERS